MLLDQAHRRAVFRHHRGENKLVRFSIIIGFLDQARGRLTAVSLALCQRVVS